MTATLAVVMVVGAGTALAADNSDAAHACQQGGYLVLSGGTADGPDASVTFKNTGDCVSYAAHGGILWEAQAPRTFRINATLPQWQDSGINLQANQLAVISVVNDGGGTCSTSSWDCAFYSQFWGTCYICLVDGVNFYGIAGEVGSGPVFTAWLPFGVHLPTHVSGPGEVSFAFNDETDYWAPPYYAYFDNAGYMTATVSAFSRIN
jgi:opacity protein-like surface antigen